MLRCSVNRELRAYPTEASEIWPRFWEKTGGFVGEGANFFSFRPRDLELERW